MGGGTGDRRRRRAAPRVRAAAAFLLAAAALATVQAGSAALALPALIAFALFCLAEAYWLRRELDTAAWKRAPDAAEPLAVRDSLTGLYNRRALTRFFAEGGADVGMTLLLCDLDRFRQINEQHGHRSGDLVLREIAARLHQLGGDYDDLLIVRLGGDEFACAVRGAGGAIAGELSRRIADAVEAPVAIGEASVRVTVSIGSAWATGRSLAGLLAAAEADMSARKRGTAAVAGGDAAPPTRRLLERALIAGDEGDDRPVFVAMIGIDRWRSIRATVGYAAAARLLRDLAARVTGHVAEAAVAHVAGEAVAVGFRAADPVDAERVVAALRAACEGPARVADDAAGSVDVQVVIGYAGPGTAGNVRALTEQARIAFDQASQGHRRQALFCEAAYGDPLERLALMADLRSGLAADEFALIYQPKLRTSTGTVDSVEALIRWHHPQRGPIPPEEFVTVAEETGDIRAMTFWVLRRAVEEQAQLIAAGLDLVVYVNISARLVGDTAFTGELLRIVETAGGRIGIEITETAVIDDPTNALANLRTLADAGLRLAIDDYGSGMSSLAYLKQLPAHELKIDRLFVKALTSSHRDPMIVRSTIDLAHGLGLEVTAEGVDNASSLALLQVMGCDLVQGFIVARPMPLPALIAFCRDNAASAAATLSHAGPAAVFERHADFWRAKPTAA